MRGLEMDHPYNIIANVLITSLTADESLFACNANKLDVRR